MSKLERYPAYKDSGVTCIGEIPKHWEIKKLKFLTKNLNNRRIPIESTIRGKMENRVYDYYGATGVIDKVEDYIYDEPTIVIAEDGANLLLRNLQLVYLAEGKYWVNNHAHILRTASINNRYYIANALENTDYTTLISGSAQPKLTKDNLNNVLLAVPPEEEQTKIASFLDKKTAQIDKAISQKEKLIELFKERRQIVINEAVTKGLDKAVEFKDSGVEWIEEIPKHWKLERLGSNFMERKEKVSDKDFEPLSVTKNGIVPQLDNAAKTNDGDNRKLVRKGDFVINSRSDRKGSSGLSRLDGSVSLINIVLKPVNINSEFSHIVLKSNGFIEEFYRNGHGIVADLWTTKFWDMKSIMLAIPPKNEQIKIAEYIETQTAKIDNAIELQQNYIAKLKEYKASLIDSVVTGKVRVA